MGPLKRTLRPVGLVIALIALALLAVVALAAVSPGVRSSLASILGDELRNDIVAFTSRLNVHRVETMDMVQMPHTGMNPLGVNTFLEQEAELWKRRRTFEVIRDAGIGWIRQQFPWEDIEVPSKGRYWDEKYNQSTWDKYDSIVDLANEYGIQMIVRLDLPPKWANPNNPWPHSPPDSFEDYGDFVNTVVSRYKGKVKYYQLWNEPNLAIEWGNKPVDAAQYVELLKIGYQRAKEADPDAVILSAALAPTIEESWQALNDQIYLQQMYDAGAKDYFDIMSVMAYGLRSGPDDRRLDLRDVNFSRPLLIREIMVRNGDASKPVWASEMGWNAQPEWLDAEPVYGRVSEELQARYTVRAFQRAAEEWPWMGVMNLWFLKRASDAEKDQPFYYFRMMEPDFEPHPVYEAVKQYGASTPTVQRGFHQENHWAVQYTGEWIEVAQPGAGLGRVISTTQAGATMTMLFQGTELDLIVSKGPSMGKAHIRIDGARRSVGSLPQDKEAGSAVLDLSAPFEVAQRRVPIARGLTNGVHRFELTALGPVTLDGFVVSSREIPFILQPLSRAAIAFTAVGFALALALLAARSRRRQAAARGRPALDLD
jgi:polysaccharide biosynthesis protein PslG